MYYQEIMFNNNKKTNSINLDFFKNLLHRLDPKQSEESKKETADCLVKCLIIEPNCYGFLKDNYSKYLVQSAYLIECINKHWDRYSASLTQSKKLQNLIKYLQVANEELSVGKRKEGLQQSIRACEVSPVFYFFINL